MQWRKEGKTATKRKKIFKHKGNLKQKPSVSWATKALKNQDYLYLSNSIFKPMRISTPWVFKILTGTCPSS